MATKQKFLVTYSCVSHVGNNQYGMAVTEDVVGWLEECQQYTGETYYLINQMPVTDEEAARIDGQLRGM